MADRCALCKRLCKSKRNCMRGDGPEYAEIMLVGEAPGQDELIANRPFVGKAGRFMERHILKAVGLDRRQIRITNAVRCMQDGKNITPTIGEIRNCRPHLVEEVKRCRPKVMVLLGNVPLNSVLAVNRKKDEEKSKKAVASGITKWQGKVVWHHEFNCWVIPTWHPSGVMRSLGEGSAYKEFHLIEDFENAMAYASIDPPSELYPKAYLCDTPKKALTVLNKMLAAKIVAVDSETDDLSVKTTRALGISVSDSPTRGAYILWECLEDSKVSKAFAELLVAKNIQRVFHNGAFDEKVFHFRGFKVGKHVDTMLAATLIDENFPKGLKNLTWRYLHFGGYDTPLEDYVRINRIKKYGQIPVNVMYKYASLDAAATIGLWLKFKPMLEEQELMEHFIERQMPARRTLTHIEINGFAIKTDYSKELLKKLETAVAATENRIQNLAGIKFNINSPIQLRDVLFRRLKLPAIKTTAKGSQSTDSSVLQALATRGGDGGRVAKFLLTRAKIKKYISTFVSPLIKNVWQDGRIHTNYNLAGTVTGRCSCSDPGIHGVPRDRLIRSQFISKLGNLIVSDVKSAELRVLAIYSGEPALIRAFIEKRDIHTEVFNTMFKKRPSYVPTEDERFIAKTISFGLIYGRGAQALALVLGVSVEEAEDLIDQFFETFPRAKKWLDGTVALAKKQGYVISLFGRRRRLPEIQYDDRKMVARAARQAKNSLIQGTAAEATFKVMTRIDERLRREHLRTQLVHTVHDSIIADSPIKENKMVERIVREAFAEPIPRFTVPLEVDISFESRWGEHKDSSLEKLLISLKEEARR